MLPQSQPHHLGQVQCHNVFTDHIMAWTDDDVIIYCVHVTINTRDEIMEMIVIILIW